jgi:hypothetical protein
MESNPNVVFMDYLCYFKAFILGLLTYVVSAYGH